MQKILHVKKSLVLVLLLSCYTFGYYSNNSINRVCTTVLFNNKPVNLICEFTYEYNGKAQVPSSKLSTNLVSVKNDILKILMEKPSIEINQMGLIRSKILNLLNRKLNPLHIKNGKYIVGIQKLYIQSIDVKIQ